MLQKVEYPQSVQWHTCPVCPGPRSTPGKGLDRLRSQENPYLDPWHVSLALSSQKLDVQSVTRGTRVQCVQGHVAHLEGI